MYPNAPLIKRNGEIDAWDNEDFRAAIRATGKKQVIVAGIVTDVCKSSNKPGLECNKLALVLERVISIRTFTNPSQARLS